MITVRTATVADGAFVGGLVESLLEFGSPMWRDPRELAGGYRAVLVAALEGGSENAQTLIAEGADGEPLGFVSLRVVDAVGSGPRGHIADLVVVPEARGGGVGTALIRAAERWCRERGLDAIDLDVWATNDRAISFYVSRGYLAESHHLAKRIDANPEAHGG